MPTSFSDMNHPMAYAIVSILKDLGIRCIFSKDHHADRVYYQDLTLMGVRWSNPWKVEVNFNRLRAPKIWLVINLDFNTEEERCRAPEMIVEQLLRERPELLAESC